MMPLFRGLYRDDRRQPQPRKPRAPKPRPAPKTAAEKRTDKLAHARAMVKLWSKKVLIAGGRLRGWHRALARMERQAAIDAAVAKATAPARVGGLRKITLEG